MTDDEKFEKAIADEVRRRRCPDCKNSLIGAAVATEIHENRCDFSYTCVHCQETHVGGMDLTPAIRAEVLGYATKRRPTQGITADELVDLHIALSKWDGNLRSLVKP